MVEDKKSNPIKDRLYQVGFEVIKSERWQPYTLKYSKRIDDYVYTLWYHPDTTIVINEGRIGDGYSSTIFHGMIDAVDKLNDIISAHKLDRDFLEREKRKKLNKFTNNNYPKFI